MIAAFLRATYRGMADGAANVDEAVAIMVKARPLLKPDVTRAVAELHRPLCSDGMDGKPSAGIRRRTGAGA